MVDRWSLIEQLPCEADYNALRGAVGWAQYPPKVAAHSLSHSLYGVCALCDGQVIGMARVVGDDGMVFYIQDVIVLPEHQGHGIGSRMMDRVMAYIRAHAHENSVVGLMAAAGKEGFYTRYGFTARPTETLGCGMTLFWRGGRPSEAFR